MTSTSDIGDAADHLRGVGNMGAVHPQFSVLDDAWIAVRLVDGSAAEVSLRDAFHRADEIAEITGDLPTQAFAILRLMLAILYRTLRGDKLTIDVWAFWRENGLPNGDIDDYFDLYADRFELFHPERPFFQVADLATASGDHKDVSPLILDLPSNNRLFTNRAGSGASSLSFAEATRWLVDAQAWDPSGIKSGALGDPRVKGGKGYPLGLAWAGLLGGVYVQGQTLRDTLLLNLVATDDGLDVDAEWDVPPWEEEQADDAAEREGIVPRGPVRLYTWQARRIRLFPSGSRVTGCLVTNGDRLTPQNQQTHEPMSAWRFSEPQTKAAKQTTYMPREHQQGRAMWRGIGALLPELAVPVPKRDIPASLPPGIVGWLQRVEDETDLLPSRDQFRLRAIGVVYGSNNSVVDEVIDDEVLIPVALLRDRNRPLAAQAQEAVRLADEGVLALRHLAENLDRAAGGTGEGARVRAGEVAYAAFDAPYRCWLASLTDASDPVEVVSEWKRTAYGILRELGTELIETSGPAAWVGRDVSRGGRTDLITTPRAEGWFLSSLAKTFGAAARKEEAA
ncbi:type I-E CRISPR-associated protein Cse1/CasA [Microbacterium sp.]|uniref:type I-E CRISPR-associated protein Cse1/CasA n=1 Tax=Microbacterium sp. TaxID=51671 RepID=UPI0039E4FC16